MRNPNTLLFKAIETGDMNALERALESGADVDPKDPYRLTAAMLAADKGHADCSHMAESELARRSPFP